MALVAGFREDGPDVLFKKSGVFRLWLGRGGSLGILLFRRDRRWRGWRGKGKQGEQSGQNAVALGSAFEGRLGHKENRRFGVGRRFPSQGGNLPER